VVSVEVDIAAPNVFATAKGRAGAAARVEDDLAELGAAFDQRVEDTGGLLRGVKALPGLRQPSMTSRRDGAGGGGRPVTRRQACS
jgi:hypothetical protein